MVSPKIRKNSHLQLSPTNVRRWREEGQLCSCVNSGVFKKSTALQNWVHQYAVSPPISWSSQKTLMYCSVESKLIGLTCIRMYTKTGKMSSAPGGSPHFANCKSRISSLQALAIQSSLACGDCRETKIFCGHEL